MPEASAASVAASPVSRRRMKSLGSSRLGSRAPPPRLVPAQPEQLGRLEAGAGPVAGDRDHALAARARSISAHSAWVRASFHNSAGRIGCPHDRGTPSRASGRRGRGRRSAGPAATAARRRSTSTAACHQSSGFCSVQPGRGGEQRVGGAGPRQHGATRREQHALGAAGADVDPDRRPLVGHGASSLLVQPAGPDFTRIGPSSIGCVRLAGPSCRRGAPLLEREAPSDRVPCRSRATMSSISPCPRGGWRTTSCASSTMPASA